MHYLLGCILGFGFILWIHKSYPVKESSEGIITVETRRSFDRYVHEHIRPDGTRCVIYEAGYSGGISCDFTNKDGVEKDGSE